ncbi:MAG: MFS transporter [Anaerolineae bacterium]|nr:MAG: MFS transporter [Anaerolineae bacterium]
MRLALLALTTFVLFLSTLVGTPAIPELVAELGANATATAATLSSALMTVVLLQFFTGGLADRYGRRFVLGRAALAGGFTSLGCALAGSWHWLLAMRVLGGVADAVAMPALLGLTAEISEGRQGTFFGVLRSAQGLSFILGPAIGGALSFVSLRAPFVVDAVFSSIACVLLVRFVPAKAASPDEGHSWAQLRRLKALFTDRRYYAFALFCGVDNVAFPVLSAFLPVKARSLGADPRQISLMLALEAVCFSLACWLVGQASDRWGRRAFVIAAQPGVISSCVGLALAQSWPWLVAWYALFGLASGATFLVGLLMAADVTPRADAAGTLGAFDAAVDLLIFAAPAAALAVHRQLGRTDPLLLAAGLPALLALPVALVVSETKKAT